MSSLNMILGLVILLIAHYPLSSAFSLITQNIPTPVLRGITARNIGKRSAPRLKVTCQDYRAEKSNLEWKESEYVPANQPIAMQLDDEESILVAKLRRKIQEAVFSEDFSEAANLQAQLKTVLQKATKNQFLTPESISVSPALVLTPSGNSMPVPTRSTSAPKRLVLSDPDRARLDESDDSIFWGKPRMVVHHDMEFAIRLEKLYRERLPVGSSVLDLGASCTTFLPDIPLSRVVGLGMNMEELEANEALTERFVQDLNACCSLPFADESFDAVICSGTLHYLRNPEAVLAEVRRVLRPSGVAIVSFTDRSFDSKIVAAWRSRGTLARCDLIAECLSAAGGMTPPQRFLEMSPLTSLSHLVPAARGLCGDPFAALVSYKGSPPPGWAVRLDSAADVRVPVLGMTIPSLKITPFAAVFLLYVLLSHH